MNLLKLIGNGYFMGMNFRNNVLVKKLNSLESTELVNDKLRYKQLLHKRGIRTPRLIMSLDSMSLIESNDIIREG